MLSYAEVAATPDFTVTAVACRDDHRGWSAVESAGGHRLVLVRRGRFRRRADGVAADVDPTVAYVGVPGEEEHFAHPSGGDACTLITVTASLWRTFAGTARVTRSTVYVDARLDLIHRRLLAADDVEYGLIEQLTGLLSRVVEQVVAGSAPAGSRSSKVDVSVVAAARAAIAEEDPAARGLFPLAALLGVSPYRLSRAFSRELGVSLTRYRNRVRLGRALDRLADGEPSLAVLAADLGFADQAHLCRTMTDHLGRTPTAVRRLLTR